VVRTNVLQNLEDEAAPSFALVDQVYDGVREAIREGVFRAGQRLVERDLAARLNVSRTPVREALRLLEAHGLAATLGGRGLFVTSLAPNDVSELYFAWENLEALAARTAAQHATDLEIEGLQQVHALWNESGDPRTLGRLNKRFHAAIHRAMRNRFLSRALRTIDDSVTLLGLTTYTIPGRGREVAAEHAAIVEAIARRDANRAETAARQHIRRAGQLRLALTEDTDAPAAIMRRGGGGASHRA
jgi:DNA-binding GntR family transcriptional regulator